MTCAGMTMAQGANGLSSTVVRGLSTSNAKTVADCHKPYRSEWQAICIAKESAKASQLAEILSAAGLCLVILVTAANLWATARAKKATRAWVIVDWPNGKRQKTTALPGAAAIDAFVAEITYRNSGLSAAAKVRVAVSQVTVLRGGAPVAEIVAVDDHASFAPGQSVVHSACLKGKEVEAFLGGALDWYLLVELHYLDTAAARQTQVSEASYRALLTTDHSGQPGIRFHSEGAGSLQ